jgi:hypothetical protein
MSVQRVAEGENLAAGMKRLVANVTSLPDYTAMPEGGAGPKLKKKKRGYKVCSSGYGHQLEKEEEEEEEEEEGLQGVFKRLRRNGHQLEKGCCEQLSSDCH